MGADGKLIYIASKTFKHQVLFDFFSKRVPEQSFKTNDMSNQSRLRVLLIGKGGRESALALKLGQSPRVEEIFVVPGNGGTAKGIDKVSNIDHVSDEDFDGLVKLSNELRINLVVPGRSSSLLYLITLEWSFSTITLLPLSI